MKNFKKYLVEAIGQEEDDFSIPEKHQDLVDIVNRYLPGHPKATDLVVDIINDYINKYYEQNDPAVE